MAYYEDLTPYEYDEDARGDLNVGWLEAGRTYPKAEPAPALVAALLRCSRRPVRLYRGFHDCDLCEDASAVQTWPFQSGGRRYYLGNGEIRVQGADMRWFAAPTLVAHYVAHHHYAPPPAFCDAVIEVAHRLPNLDANALAALAAMSPSERLDFCLDLVRASNVVGHPWATTALQALLAARPAIDPSRRKEFRAELDALYDVIVLAQDPADGPPPWLHEATKNAVQIVFAARSEETLDEDSFDLAADAIESVLEGGVDVSATMMRLT